MKRWSLRTAVQARQRLVVVAPPTNRQVTPTVPFNRATEEEDGNDKIHVLLEASPSSSTSICHDTPPQPPQQQDDEEKRNADVAETTNETPKKSKKKKSSKKKEGDKKSKKKDKKKSKRKEDIVVVVDSSNMIMSGSSSTAPPVTDDTSVTSVSTTSPKSVTPKVKHKRKKSQRKVLLTPAQEDFYERVSFAFALCRRQTSHSPNNNDDDDCFLPLMRVTLDATNLHSLARLAKKNADLHLTKLHLYQLRFEQHGDLEALLDIFQKRFPTLRRLVISSECLRIQDMDAMSRRFENLTQLLLYGGHAYHVDEFFSPAWDETWCRLASTVARQVTFPHMGGRLPEGIYRGLCQPTCIVQELHLKLDYEADVSRLVSALCQGRSVRRLRLESAACRASWLDELLMQYDQLEQLELYHCQNTHQNDDDRLAAWMI